MCVCVSRRLLGAEGPQLAAAAGSKLSNLVAQKNAKQTRTTWLRVQGFNIGLKSSGCSIG